MCHACKRELTEGTYDKCPASGRRVHFACLPEFVITPLAPWKPGRRHRAVSLPMFDGWPLHDRPSLKLKRR